MAILIIRSVGESTTIVADGSVSLTNAKDNIMLSAHTGRLEATAKQDVNIASSTKEVEIVASNKVTINAGGASITLEGGDITIKANEFVEKAVSIVLLREGLMGKAFGTLDEDSLDVALNTLTNLQQEGKLIGIISHVQALKDRIHTQIRVDKLSGGYSKISGPGCLAIKR